MVGPVFKRAAVIEPIQIGKRFKGQRVETHCYGSGSTRSATYYCRGYGWAPPVLFFGTFGCENVVGLPLEVLFNRLCVSPTIGILIRTMQQFFNNRYVQLTGLTIVVGTLFFLMIWLVSSVIGLDQFPVALQAVLAFLAAGIVVYKFFSQRIA